MGFFTSGKFVYAIVIILIAVFAFFVIKSYRKKLTQGCCGGGSDEKVQKVKVIDTDKKHYPFKTILTVDGMVCSNCEQRVENALNVLSGTWAKASASSGTVTVLSKEEPDENELRSAVNSIGAYTVMDVKLPQNS